MSLLDYSWKVPNSSRIVCNHNNINCFRVPTQKADHPVTTLGIGGNDKDMICKYVLDIIVRYSNKHLMLGRRLFNILDKELREMLSIVCSMFNSNGNNCSYKKTIIKLFEHENLVSTLEIEINFDICNCCHCSELSTFRDREALYNVVTKFSKKHHCSIWYDRNERNNAIMHARFCKSGNKMPLCQSPHTGIEYKMIGMNYKDKIHIVTPFCNRFFRSANTYRNYIWRSNCYDVYAPISLEDGYCLSILSEYDEYQK